MRVQVRQCILEDRTGCSYMLRSKSADCRVNPKFDRLNLYTCIYIYIILHFVQVRVNSY